MSIFFKKGGMNTFFKKGTIGNTYFRKGYNTLNKIGQGISNIGNLAERASPYVSAINPLIGSGLSKGGFIANTLGQNLNKVADQAKLFKKSIERE